MKHAGGRPPKYKTAEDLEKAVDAYFEEMTPKPITYVNKDGETVQLQDKSGQPVYTQAVPTTAGLALYLGYCDRASLYDSKERGEEFSNVIKKAITRIMQHHEECLTFRDKPVGNIFWLKNHQWHDKQEIEHSGELEIKLTHDTEGI